MGLGVPWGAHRALQSYTGRSPQAGDCRIREPEGAQGQGLAPSPKEAHTAGRLLPRAPRPHPPPELTRLTMATLSRLPIVRTARDKRSRGWVSTLSEMACNTPRAGQHLCGVVGSGGRRQHRDKDPLVQVPSRHGGC